jgi:hypothetical protein
MYVLITALICAGLLGLVGGLLTKDVLKERKREASERFEATRLRVKA